MRISFTRSFCHIPVNILAGIITAVVCLISTSFAIADGFALFKSGRIPTCKFVLLDFGGHGVVNILVAVISMVGLLAVMFTAKGLARFHFWTAALIVPFSIASGAALLYALFNPTPDTRIAAYLFIPHANISRIVALGLSVFLWLCQILGVFVDRAYCNEFEEWAYRREENESFYS